MHRQCYSTIMNPTCVWSGIRLNLDYVSYANQTIAWQTEGGVRRTLVNSCENCCVPVFIADWKEEGQTIISQTGGQGEL